jgi:integral membrane sensor domain MASE1
MNERRPLWSWALLLTALATVYYGTGRLCIGISAQVANVSWMLFIPAGLALIAALLWGRAVAIGVFAGEFAMTLASDEPLLVGLLMAAGNGLDAALAGWWFHDRLGRRIEFDRLRDVVQLILAELLVLQPLSTAMGMFALTSAGHLPAGQLWTTASAWYAANVFAIFLAAPAALAWLRWSRPADTRAQRVELGALGALTLLAAMFGAGRWAIDGLPLPVTLIVVFPLLVWAAVRFVPSVAVTVGTTLGLFAFDAVLAGQGPLAGIAVADRMFYLNVFMGVCIGTSLFLGAAMGEERRHEAEQARLIGELKTAVDQVKRLEDFVTFCAWTGRVRWNDEWVSVERFLRERYNLTVSHGISEDGIAKLLADMPKPPEEPGAPGKPGPGAAQA